MIRRNVYFMAVAVGWYLYGQSLIFNLFYYSSRYDRSLAAIESSSSSKNRKSLLVVVPGIGNIHNLDNLYESLSAIKKSVDAAQYGFQCIVYVWNVTILDETSTRLKDLCRAKFNKGLWTHHMKRPLPFNNASHVAVLLDDVNASQVDMVHTLELMERSKFDGASPSYFDRVYPCMHPRDNCLSHRTDYVNILLTIMTTPLWECFQSLIDLENNDHGWGMDILLSDFCNASLGIIDNYTIVHADKKASYETNRANRQLFNYIQVKTGAPNPRDYFRCVHRERSFGYFANCTLYRRGHAQYYNQSDNERIRKVCSTNLPTTKK